MQVIPIELSRAALAARDSLSGLSRTAATADAVPGRAAVREAMAAAAQRAIFVDALSAAMHARLEELKSVTK